MEVWQYNLFEPPKEIGQKSQIIPYERQKGEDKDITRLKILDKLYKKIYILLQPKFNEEKIGKYIIYHDELQAEIEDTQNLSIRNKIKLHIKAIRELRNDKN